MVIDRALSTHPQILAKQKAINEARGLIRQAGLRPNPSVQFSAGSSSILGEPGDREWSAEYVHTFELGSKRQKRLSIAEIGLMIAKLQLQDQKRQLAFEIKKQFADIVSTRLILEATTRSVDLHRRLHEFTVAKVNEGEAAAVEKSLSQIELSRLELESATLKADLAGSISKLQLATGLKSDESISDQLEQTVGFDKTDVQETIETAKKKNPQLQISNLELLQAGASLELTKAEAIPDLNTFLQYSNETSKFDAFGLDNNGNSIPLEDRDQIISAGISFNLPFNRNQGNTSAAVERLEQAKIQNEFLQRSIEQEITIAFRKVQVAQEAFKTYRDSITKQSENQVEIMRVSFEAGELRFLDWLNE
ncbi:MAG TPA: TolC family protein, partial [Acidobacteriota bacterium]|nr:TolC family protein [Acidobacteriota bacterium]